MTWDLEILDIIKLTLPAIIVFLTVIMMLKRYFENESRKRMYELKQNNSKVSLPIRLQAYERLSIFLERISVNNLILRVKKTGMTASDLQVALLAEIRAEFDHNISQQIYITSETWNLIKNAKEEIIKIINMSYGAVPAEASALDLSKAVFDIVMRMDIQPTYKALAYLKTEAQDLL